MLNLITIAINTQHNNTCYLNIKVYIYEQKKLQVATTFFQDYIPL